MPFQSEARGRVGKMIAVEPDEADDMIGKRSQQLFIGPRGGRWADSQHTISFDETPDKPRDTRDRYEHGHAKPLIKRGMRLTDAENAIRHARVEHCVAFGRHGEQLWRQVGNHRRINIPATGVHAIEKSGEAVFTHNHPGTDGAMLSSPDLLFAVQHNMREVRACSAVGTYSLRRPEGGWDIDPLSKDFGAWTGEDDDEDAPAKGMNFYQWMKVVQSVALGEATIVTNAEVMDKGYSDEVQQQIFEAHVRKHTLRAYNRAFAGTLWYPEEVGFRPGPAIRETRGWHISFTPAPRANAGARAETRGHAGRRTTAHVQASPRSKMSKALPEVHDCPRCNGPMVGKCGPTCGCSDAKSKRRLPMIGKADESFDEMPAELRTLISQLPFEIQASELGGAGSTDTRPTMLEANYEMPARHAGSCVTCDHSRHESVVIGGMAVRSLACSALATQPPVAASARCDLWTGRDQILIGKASNGGGPTVPFGVQRLPDYQEVYGITPDEDEARLRATEEENRRLSNRERNTGRYGFHGQPPEPHLRNEAMQHTPHMTRPLGRMDNKPQVMPPLIFKRQPADERERLVKRPAGLPVGTPSKKP